MVSLKSLIKIAIQNELDESINPAIESHDARCDLVELGELVDNTIPIILSLTGPCNRCSSINVTGEAITMFIDELISELGYEADITILSGEIDVNQNRQESETLSE